MNLEQLKSVLNGMSRASKGINQTVLCEECFPDYANREVLATVPLTTCVSCGRRDERRADGLRCHLFGSDPREPSPESSGEVARP